MTTEVYEMQSHNSPWTDVFDMHCEREDAATADMSTADEQAEQEPTHNALADVYNRDDTKTNGKRF
ncbi:MAG: hypothetical protein Phog2KO_27530 [Phototrophicaceae bacterium]